MRLQVTCTRATSGHRDVPTCPNSEDLRGTVVSGYCAVTRSFQTMVWRTYLIYLVYDIRCTYTFAIPSIVFALVFSLPPNRSSDPGLHSRLISPLPTTVRALHFYRETKKDQLLKAPASSVGKHNSTRVDEGRKSCNLLAIKNARHESQWGEGEKSLLCGPGSELRLGRTEKEGRR